MFENLPSPKISAHFIKTIEVIFDAGLAVQMSPKAICRRTCDAGEVATFNFSCKDRRNFVDVFYAKSSVIQRSFRHVSAWRNVISNSPLLRPSRQMMGRGLLN